MQLEQLKIILENHKKWLRSAEGGVRADLSRADLYGADLSGANLSGADLSGADLSGANLSGANLSRANLSGANLSRADLYGANLSGADLYGANLYGANSDFSILLSISGMRWFILIKDDLVKVGCQEHTYQQWKQFTVEQIENMARGALSFYNGILIPLLDHHYKGTKFEIK